jgi:O-antigen/teichoic acid export membrane protein
LTGVGSLLVGRVFAGGATLLLFALLAHRLPSAQFGLFGVAWSASYLFAAAVEGGYGLLVVREIARAPAAAGYYLGAFMAVRVALTVVAFTVAFATGVSTGWDTLAAVITMAATAANLQVVSGVPRDFLIGSDRPELAAAHAIVETILRTIVILTTAAFTTSVTAIFAAAALFHLAWIAVGVPLVWQILHPIGVRAGVRAWRPVLRKTLPFGALIVLIATYAQLDMLIVSTLLPLESVAIFLVASRILAAAEYLPEAAWRWAYPKLSRSIAELPRRTSRLAVTLLSLGLAAAVVLDLAAPIAIPLVFGEEYSLAVEPMIIMAAAIPLRYLAHAYGTALSAGGRQPLRTGLFAAVICVSTVVEVLLIRAFGLTGATIAIPASSALLAGATMVACRLAWGRDLDPRPLMLAGAAAVLMVAVPLAQA